MSAPKPAAPLDKLMRPVKFVKGGGVFIAGAHSTKFLAPDVSEYAKVLRNESKSGGSWFQVAEIKASEPVTQVYSGAYGLVPGDPDLGIPDKPTFVMCGIAVNAFAREQSQQMIATSTNGNTWSITHHGPAFQVYLMAWDKTKKMFYAQAATNTGTDVLASSDGVAWSVVQTLPHSEIGSSAVSPLLEATGSPLVKDGKGRIVPWGSTFGWGETILIAPQIKDAYDPTWQINDPSPGVVDIIHRIVNEDGSVTITRGTAGVPMDHVVSVAYDGTVFQVAGFNHGEDAGSDEYESVIATSTDKGESWQVAYRAPKQFIGAVMAGDPIR